MKIFGGTQSKEFAKNVCDKLNIPLGLSSRKDFADGEFSVSLDETVRGHNVYIIQSTFQPTNNLMELLMMADAAKRAGAKSIVAIIPYFGFARQEKKDSPRTPITTALIAKMIEASGIKHVITMDLHAEQISGFFDIPVTHLYSSGFVVPNIRERFFDKKLLVCSPDMGGVKRAKAYSHYLQTEVVICYKQRTEANKIKEMKVIGDVEGFDVIITDDIIDTAGTLCKCIDMLYEKGAASVRAMITHPVLSGDAYKNIAQSKLEELIVTNSIPLSKTSEFTDVEHIGIKKITVVDVAPLFADVINKVETNSSISASFLV